MSQNADLNYIETAFRCLREDCNMALDGSWDKGDDGFKAEIELINSSLEAVERLKKSAAASEQAAAPNWRTPKEVVEEIYRLDRAGFLGEPEDRGVDVYLRGDSFPFWVSFTK